MILVRAENIGVKFTAKRRSRFGFKGLAYNALRRQTRNEPFWALRGLNLQVREGELLGIIGRNGAGKTTLARVISGIYPTDEGALTVDGRVTSLAPGVGFVSDMPGRHNIYLHCALFGQSPEKVKELVPLVIEFSELGEFIDKPVRSYSSGMQARLAFSIAVHFRPDILVIDETLNVGDEAFRAKATKKIHELIAKARAVVVITHSLPFVRSYCSRVVWLQNGRVEAEGDPNAVTERYAAFVKELLKHPGEPLIQRR
jgi:teichoic acid transport system ATP-binding protein